MLKVAVKHQEIEPVSTATRSEQQRLSDLAVRHTIWLARQVYNAISNQTESFEHDDMIGPDLAYLMGSILENTYCTWPEDRPIVQLLRNSFPERNHPVWDFVEIELEDEIADETYSAWRHGGHRGLRSTPRRPDA